MVMYLITPLFASLLLGFSISVLGADFKSDFCVGKSDGLQEDPDNCQAYYNCHAQRTFWAKCGPRLLFNNKIKNCDWARNVACRDTPRGEGANFCDGKSDGLYADDTDCHKYYVCGSGLTHSQTCNGELLFNPATKACDWESNVDCLAGKTPDEPGKTTTEAQMTEKQMTIDSKQYTTSGQKDTTEHHHQSTTSSDGTTTNNQKKTTESKQSTASNKVTSGSPKQNSGCEKVVCYFTNWAQYRNGDGKQLPEDIDPFLCTHIVFSFAKLNGNMLAPFEWNDEETDWNLGNYKKVTGLKKKNPNLKVLLAVGGWNMGSDPFISMVATPTSRKEFIDTSIDFLRERRFDGLDLDWEYPANRGSPPEDKNRFSDLLRELRAAYKQEASDTGKPRLLLTAAVAAGDETVETAYDVPVLNAELDFINLMSYDLHGPWEAQTGHNSPLYSGSWEDPKTNVHWAANNWVEKGADPKNLIIGMPLYARTFRLTSASNNGVGDMVSGPGNAGMYTREKGFLAYYEICKEINSGASKGFIDEQEVPYISFGDQWAGYDDPTSLRNKVKYVRENNYGGVMVWDLSLDDMKGSFCGQGPYPLMTAINDACEN